jgi:cysteinyl-tRNA synthetase
VLKLYNTRTRRKDEFNPLDPDNVRMYVCGPTVYDYAHIGNARPIIVFDVLFRLLRHLAARGEWDGGKGETKVTYVRNITDVDDKINARAAQEGISIRELTERTTAQFHADVAALGCLPPTHEPRATEYVTRPGAPEDMIRLVQKLIARGHAYEAEGHVLFAVSSDANYGKLARRSLDEMIEGARVEVAPYKRDPMDFVLWKPSHGVEPGWDSPWGFGRPGWHLECSAMSAALLGETFDIHGGGIDLVFPHHENEVAQSTCAHGTDIMANIWMHNGFLQVEGEKMSKSVGNFITINEVLSGWSGFTWPGEAVRFNMLRTHYRQPIDWTAASLDESHKTLWKWAKALEEQGTRPAASPGPTEDVLDALGDDLNTPKMMAALHNLHKERRYQALSDNLGFLGISGSINQLGRDAAPDQRLRATPFINENTFGRATVTNVPEVKEYIHARLEARRAKNWAEADRIRDELAAMGITLKDRKNPETGEIETEWEIAR